MSKQEWKMEYDSPALVWDDALPWATAAWAPWSMATQGSSASSSTRTACGAAAHGAQQPRLPGDTAHHPEKSAGGKMQGGGGLDLPSTYSPRPTHAHYECLGRLDLALNQHTPFTSSWTPPKLGY